MQSFRVGIDSYSLIPLKLSPFETLDWAVAHGAAGVQFTDINLKEGQRLDEPFLSDLKQYAAQRDLYVEWAGGQHIPFDTHTWKKRDLGPINEIASNQANAVGATILRSCSGGLMRWRDESPPTEVLLRETADALKASMPMFADQNVTLAIEIHFEFTTFELLRIFEMCQAEPGGPVGVCLDTMNLLTMLEDPVAGTERILPWVVATHAKDGGLKLGDTGLISFTAEVGTGWVDLDRILARLATLKRRPHLSVEDHGGSFEIPIFDPTFLSRFPDLTANELAQLMRLVRENESRSDERRVYPLDRADWPSHCEQRVHRGIENLKAIVKRHEEGGVRGG